VDGECCTLVTDSAGSALGWSMRMKDGDRIELVVDRPWVEKCGWMPDLLSPADRPQPGAPVVVLECTLVAFGHPAGVLARMAGDGHGQGPRREAFEIFVPWSCVSAIRTME